MTRNLSERLVEWNRETVDRYSHGAAEHTEQEGPRPGDLFVLRLSGSASDLPVEWAVIEQDDDGRVLAVAADTHPSVGSADVDVPEEHACGPLRLRCAVTVRLESGRFDRETQTGQLGPEILDQVRRKRSEIAQGSTSGSARARDTDSEAEYQVWMQQLREVRSALLEPVVPLPSRRRPTHRRSPHRRPTLRILGLAAAVVVGVAVGWLAGRLRTDAPRHGDGLLNLPVAWLNPVLPHRGDSQLLALPEDAPYVWLVLETGAAPHYPSYRLEVRKKDEDGPAAVHDGLTRSTKTAVGVALPRRGFESGEHRLDLFGIGDGEPVKIGEYRLRLEKE